MAKRHNEISIWQLLGLVLILAGGMGVYTDYPALFGGSGDMPTFIVGLVGFLVGATSFWIFRRK